MQHQTRQPDEWIVADDGEQHALLSLGQAHIIQERRYEKGASLAANILAGLERASGDIIVIWEHDDYYAPEHLDLCYNKLCERSGAVGSDVLRYFNVEHRMWIVMQNVGSALCNTAFTKDHADVLKREAEALLETEKHNLDGNFWSKLHFKHKFLHKIPTVVGIKGLPGRAGLGLGHRVDRNRRWQTDPTGEVLKEWLGSDADPYLEMLGPV
jgi:glycosyltransferase involved in cell wall biosynthesis